MINTNSLSRQLFDKNFSDFDKQLLEFCSVLSFFTKNLLEFYLLHLGKQRITENTVDNFLAYSFVTKRTVSFNTSTVECYYVHELVKERFTPSFKNMVCYTYIINKYYNSISQTSDIDLKNMFYEEKLLLDLKIGKLESWKRTFQLSLETRNTKECKKLIYLYREAVNSKNCYNYSYKQRIWYNYYELVVNYYDGESKDNLIRKAYKILSECKDLELFVYVYSFIGILNLEINNCKTAYDNFLKAWKICRKIEFLNINVVCAICLNCMATCIKIKKYDQARKHYCFLKTSLATLNSNLVIAICKTVAMLEYSEFNLDKALSLYMAAGKKIINYQHEIHTIADDICNEFVPKPLFYSDEHCVYDRIGEIFIYQGEFDKAISVYMDFLISQKKIHNPIGIAWAKYNLGRAQYLSGNIQLANRYFNDSIMSFNDLSQFENCAYVYGEKSYVYQYAGKIEESIESLQRSVNIFLKFNMPKEAVFYLNHLGRLYQSQGFLDVSEKVFNFCLSYFLKTNCTENIGWVYNNFARNCMYKNHFKVANIYFKKAKLYFIRCKNKRGLTYVNNNIGELLLKLDATKTAEKYLYSSLLEKEKMGDRHAICYSYREIGEYYLKKGCYSQASTFLNHALKLCEKNKFDMLLGDIFLSLAKCYDTQGDIFNASSCFKKAITNFRNQNFLSRLINCYRVESNSTVCNNNLKLKHLRTFQALCINIQLEKQQNLISKNVDNILKKIESKIIK